MGQAAPIGFIGLGEMGGRMALRLLDAGYALMVYNRTAARVDSLVARGATSVGSPREVAAACGTVITMLADPAAVEAVLSGPDGLLAGSHAGLVWIDMSTVGPADARAAAAKAADRGISVMHAPVLGSIGPAERGELVVLAGGQPETVEAQRALLMCMGRAVYHVGGDEQACAMKLAVNVMLLGTFQLFGEAAIVATRWGVPRQKMLEIMAENPTVSPVLKSRLADLYGPAMPLTFPLPLARKDLWLALSAGYAAGAVLPMIAAAVETFTLALRDHAHEDEARIAAFIDELGATPDET
jgi:3-hydroxyisobutyrate dehydrogenase-like beta-hydroxyacid dehydrogenase